MKNLKYAWLLVVLLVLAACGRMGAPEAQLSEDAPLTTLDVVQGGDVVVSGGNTSRTPGYQGSARFYLEVTDNNTDNVNGCNASSSEKVKITVTSSDTKKITIASPGYLEFTDCVETDKKTGALLNTQSINYEILSTATKGPVTIKGVASGGKKDKDGKHGKFTDAVFEINVTVPEPTDTTAPVITPTVTGTLGGNDWYTSNVTVVWNVIDNESGIASSSGCDSTTVMDDTAAAGTTLTCNAKNGAGLSASKSVTIKRDATAPAVTPDSVNNTTWRKTDLAQAFEASDAASGLANADNATFTLTASAESTKNTEGNVVPTTVSKTVSDKAGNSTTRSVSALIDTTNPTITASAKTADGQAYTSGHWTNQNVTVSFTCSDTLSGIAQGACPDPVNVSNDTAASGQSISNSVSDRAGNSAVSNAVVVKIDKAKPTITASAGSYDGNWTNQNVTVSFTCNDALSGIAENACPANVTVESDTSTSGQVISGSVSDRAGNSETSNTITVKVDKSAPSVNVTGVSTGATYTLGSVPTAGCSTTDALSGVDTHATLGSSVGGPVGEVTVNCTGAKDNAGNIGSASVTYKVVYNFTGFFSPVDMKDSTGKDIFNVAKAGSAIPVKFKLGGNQGLEIFAGTPKVVTVSCPTSAPSDTIEELSSATTSGLKYDATADQYVYVWKTGSWADTCRRLEVKLIDGETYSALFRFNK